MRVLFGASAVQIIAALALALVARSTPAASGERGTTARLTKAAVDGGASAGADGFEGYAQSFSSLNESVRAYERDPQNHYTYCIRTKATYECLSYGLDGQINKSHPTALAHGTGVAYQTVNGESYVLTNQHVAEWPLVTDAAHPAGEVPPGCKLTNVSLKIVDNESDDYEGDDIPLTEVVADPGLDAAILKTKTQLRIMPYPIGRSSQIKVGDVVVVKGFPLGVFRAITTGQVINVYDHDESGDWNHDDFIIDAPLSEGNSGSPVLAISNRTGEYEFIGLFHAHYIGGQSLNAVIAVEQLRDLMTTLKRTPRSGWVEKRAPPDQRADFLKALAGPGFVPFFQLGARLVEVRRLGEVIAFEIYSTDFPKDGWRDLLLVDSPAAAAWGAPTELWFSRGADFFPVEFAALDAKSQSAVGTLARRLHSLANDTVTLRVLRSQSTSSRQALAQFEQFKKLQTKVANGDPGLSDSVDDLVATWRGRAPVSGLPIDAVWARLAPSPAPASLPLPPALSAPTRSDQPVVAPPAKSPAKAGPPGSLELLPY